MYRLSPATIPSRADHKRRLFIFWVIMEAVAAGIISNAETRITPLPGVRLLPRMLIASKENIVRDPPEVQ